MNTDNKIIIFDTTLRDGEQSPGASMNLDEKLRIASVLEEMGVDIIEAGFPIASDGDFEAVNEIAKVVKNSTVCGLARATHGDIERAADAIKPAERGRIHTFISTSPLHMEYKLQMEPDAVYEAVKDSVSFARNFTDDVEWSAEDGSRTEHDFLCKCVEAAIDAGAGTINIPDTVGYALPFEFAALIEMLFNRVPNIDKAIISVHCHNDLGLGVANSLAAVQAGARQIECTINGLGERAGNAAMEEVVMGLKTRHDAMPYTTGIDSTQITKASKLVSTVTGFTVQPNKAIVGANAFAHESGIHQDGMLKHAGTYEIITPESVGLGTSKLVLGKHSGSHAFAEKLKDLGYDLGDNAIKDAFKRFKDLADVKKDVYDDDIVALVDDEVVRSNDRIRLDSLQIVCGTMHRPPKAELALEIDGEVKSCESSGDGPVDAAFNAVKELFPHNARLQLYQVHAVTEGTDAQAKVTVRLEEDGKTVNGQSADTDTMVASVNAYINALNKLLVKREKTAPSALSA
ncbi:MAG: 2-isopropylmalate synthase [Rhodospirillaceae bacterium]|jgi:2-isopropylmalate synthase|nr:2-isopropylmalate synthase [Rhodospirillaceae bacterium]MBT4219745.1 2-isopropylmalate synthase [Rhodospirillaceae bacterium]MBT5013018.1 2-isopropylmalate synthase [Rhodospirillaceae bacterium]MBT6406210.1 2-isopropylmalate synthase [Rhodospirillaceae bacterium]MBT7357125.1 2-isopropylmalate synthase [Rhodospirillaceae bacterium]